MTHISQAVTYNKEKKKEISHNAIRWLSDIAVVEEQLIVADVKEKNEKQSWMDFYRKRLWDHTDIYRHIC